MQEVSQAKAVAISLLILAALFAGGVFVFSGPSGISRSWSNYQANWGGSDWLVVQYAQDGSVIATWELHDQAMGSEQNSDGIFFTDNDGNVVHLSGHYVYVQVTDGKWEPVRERFTGGRK